MKPCLLSVLVLTLLLQCSSSSSLTRSQASCAFNKCYQGRVVALRWQNQVVVERRHVRRVNQADNPHTKHRTPTLIDKQTDRQTTNHCRRRCRRRRCRSWCRRCCCRRATFVVVAGVVVVVAFVVIAAAVCRRCRRYCLSSLLAIVVAVVVIAVVSCCRRRAVIAAVAVVRRCQVQVTLVNADGDDQR